MPDPTAFITANLPATPVPGLPHIRLHTATPTSGVWRLAADGVPPYWAWPWPGGLALAHHLAAHPELVAGKSVLDLGTGSGLLAIAAALAGASSITAADPDFNAIANLKLNATLNTVTIAALQADILDGSPPDTEVILVGDLFYDPALALRVTAFLDCCLAAGAEVYVGDIGRDLLPRNRLIPLGFYPLLDFGEPPTATPRPACAYRFQTLGTQAALAIEPTKRQVPPLP
ncbi:50S ribosomal protein L11 methyltransferase [Pelagibacterium sp. H642]|uniref:class I SAM-dependent methyltransferase n=1 Tax=Pelagibacterium sp. H642 TaxID=1881069 RepID=UPI00281523A0|nr:50S ribosomal protein L11 methyltransferase [Pelagibacterium sp. H642]WMT91422.1 50S ribosomal protein L11 methyltransferase [Pelagibacterium sp. H642]